MADPERRYWDSSAFLALIKNEPDRAETCESIIGDARAGRCLIYTSMLTLTEVVKRRKGSAPVDKTTQETINAFFRNDFIKLVPVDHLIAERARNLIWDFPWLVARDAVHLATAMQLGISVVEHYDDDDLGRVGKRIEQDSLTGFPEIRAPKWVGQTIMPLEPSAEEPTPPTENQTG